MIEEDGEEQLAEVEDEELLDKLAEIFESRFEEFYEEEGEEVLKTFIFHLLHELLCGFGVC